MHTCRNASSDTCRCMPKLFKPLKIEIAIEALGNNTLVKAKSWGGPMNRVPPQPADGGAAMNICCNAFSDTCRRMPKLIRPLKSEIAIETLRSNTLVKAKSWGGPINRVPPQPADWGGLGPPGPPASAAYDEEVRFKFSEKDSREEIRDAMQATEV